MFIDAGSRIFTTGQGGFGKAIVWIGNSGRRLRAAAGRGARLGARPCRGADVSYEVELLEPKLDFV
jgi:hypothetical protein